MKAGEIVIELDLAGGQKVVARVNGVNKALDAMNATLQRNARTLKQVETNTGGFVASLRDWILIIGQARNALHQVQFLTTAWMQSIVKANAEIERLNYLMRGMSSAVTEAGRAIEADSNMDYLFKMAKETPFAINELANTFVKFKSVGIDPANGSMQALTDAVAAFGGTNEILHRATIAIQQMAGKGVISMEELRQQLGEAVPQAINLLARSVGTTYSELVDEISKGNVEAQRSLEALFGEFNRAFGGRAAQLMESFNGQVSVMRTNLMQLATEMDDNFFAAVKDALFELNLALTSENTQNAVRMLGEGLAALVRTMTDFATSLTNMPGGLEVLLGKMRTLLELAGLLIGARALRGVIGMTQGLGTASVKASRDIGAKVAAMRAGVSTAAFYATNIRSASDAAYVLGAGARAAAGGLAVLRTAFMTLLGPIAAAAAGIYAVVEVLGIFNSTHDAAVARMKEGMAISNLKDIEERMDAIDDLRKKASGLREEIAKDEADLANEGVKDSHKDIIRRRLADRKAELDKTAADIRVIERAHSESMESYRDRLQADEVMRAERRIASAGQNVRASYRAELDTLDKEFKDGKIGEGAFRTRRDEIVDALGAKLSQNLTAEINTLRTKVQEFEAAGDGLKAEAAEAAIKALEQKRDEMMNNAAGLLDGIPTVAGADTADKVTEKIESMQAALKEAQLIASGMGTNLAKLEAEINSGKFAGATPRQIEQMREYARQLDALNQAKKAGGKITEDIEKAEKQFKKAMLDAATDFDRAMELLNDPLAYQLPESIENTRNKLNGILETLRRLAAESPAAAQALAVFEKQIDQIANKAGEAEAIRDLTAIKDRTKQIRRSLMDENAAREDAFHEEVERLDRMKQALTEQGIWRVEYERIVQENIKAMRDELEELNKSDLSRMMDGWMKWIDRLEDASAGWVEGFSESLTDLMMDGSADFSDFANSVIRDIIRIGNQAWMSGLFQLLTGDSGGGSGGGGILGGLAKSIGGAIGSWFGGGSVFADVSGGASGAFGATGFNPAYYHGGGIVGKGNPMRGLVPASLFENAKRFHGGGFPGLRRDEVPAILEKGEGVFTPEQMRALGQGNGDVQVNIINQSGQPVQGQSSGPRFDGEKMVLDIVLKAMNRPGQFRDGMRENVK